MIIASSDMKIYLIILTTLIFSLIFSPPILANTQSEHNKITNRIKNLEGSLSKDRKRTRVIKTEVGKLEEKLASITDKKYQTEKSIEKLTAKLKEGEQEYTEHKTNFDQQKNGLVQQMQALHTAGSQSHLRLLLKQDDPSDISRTVKYFEYLNKNRLTKIKVIKDLMQKIEKAEVKLKTDRTELHKLEKELLGQQKEVKKIVQARKVALKKAKRSVASKTSRLKKLKRQERRLKSKLDSLIRRQNERAKKVEATRAQKNAVSKPAKKTQTNKAAPRKQAERKKKSSGKSVGSVQRFVPNKPFGSLRKKLSWPVRGKITGRYGTRRNEKQKWKGVLIEARGGSRVHAIAKGQVEFAGWFKGYGYLIIIRHDSRYRSLYGYNRAVHVREGQIVKAGAVIASVGNSGGRKKNALYFEIRKGSRPKNPKLWCR